MIEGIKTLRLIEGFLVFSQTFQRLIADKRLDAVLQKKVIISLLLYQNDLK